MFRAANDKLYKDTCRKCGARRIDQQIGLEETPDAWAAALVAVFREARRVLRKDGTLWVECGDSYASQGGPEPAQTKWQIDGASNTQNAGRSRTAGSLKPKDLIGAPWTLAFALRADGWWLRGCNIWAKPNCMPESAKDRCTTAHSYVFQLSKSARYFFDGDAILEPAEWARWGDQTVPKHSGTPTASGWIPPRPKYDLTAKSRPDWEPSKTSDNSRAGMPRNPDLFNPNGKHPRSVWTIPTQGYPEAHFATWPEALARRIILAGCPEWVCLVCGEARTRIVETELVQHRQGGKWQERQQNEQGSARSPAFSRGGTGHNETKTVGFTDCECEFPSSGRTGVLGESLGGGNFSIAESDCRPGLPQSLKYRPGIVLDPFVGSGTTCFVARKHGRRSIGIDLSSDYLALAARRLQQLSLLAEPA